MKRKKLMAAAVASALAAAQMVMPVAAASGSGSVDVDVENTDTVLRVQVPTDLVVAVDEYEIAKDGSQISSAAFEMVNKSAVPVSVAVTSTATLGTGITLAATNEVDNTADEMWLAVAAQTAKDKYGVEKIGDLTSKSANVATFDATSKAAAQTFYLAEAGGDVVYNFVDVATAGDVGEGNSFGEYHALTAVTLNSGTEQTDLEAAIAAGDVYVVAQADSTVTKIEKGSSGVTHAATNDYYTAAAASTPLANIPVGKYIYAEMSTAAAAGGEAAFRYVGKLSTNKQNWSATDFSKIVIAYTINGLNSTAYTEAVAAKNVTYGLYTTPVAPSVPGYSGTPIAKTVAQDQEIRIPVDLGAGSLGFKSIKVVWKEKGTDLVASKIVTLDAATTEMVITAASVNSLLSQDDAAAAGSKLLPLTMEVFFNGNTTADAVITLNR